MANFFYNPGVSDQRGAYLSQGMADAGRNIAAGMETLAAGIAQGEKAHKENKAYASLAETLGLDPKHATKQDVQAAILKNQVLQSIADRQKQQNAQNALGRFMQVFNAQRQGGPDYAATLAQGRGPLRNPVMAAPASTSDALSMALASNPAMFQDAKTAATASNLTRLLSSMGNDGVTIDANTGLPVLRSGNSMRVINPSWLPGGRATKPTLNTLNIPGVGNVFLNGNKQINPRMAAGGPVAGKYPKGAKIVKMDGRDVALYPDGSWSPLTGSGNDLESEIMAAVNGGNGRGADTANEPTPTPTETQTPTENFSKGDRVEQNGVNYEYDGQNWNPVD